MNERSKHAVTTLAVGLALNILLGAAKLTAGILSHSTSVTSDAVNNISDAAVSVVTIIATCLAARAADYDHPYGHGRYEYIAALLLGAVIIAVGAEVLVSGVKRAVTPEAVEADALMFITLGASVLVKSFMAGLYAVNGKRTKSDAVKAAAVDSLSDAAVTGVVLVCACIEYFTGALIDGYVSIVVSAVIIVMGLRIVKNTVNRLVGERPDKQLYDDTERIILGREEVLSVHDLRINDYGTADKTAEADAVFDADMKFVDVHRICDEIEKEVFKSLGVRLSLHADPRESGDDRLMALQSGIGAVLAAFDASAHDLEIIDKDKTVSLDIAVASDKTPTAALGELVCAEVKKSFADYKVDIRFDYI